MNRKARVPVSEKIRKAIDDFGAEPLAGSGFEDEVPEDVSETGPSAPEPPR